MKISRQLAVWLGIIVLVVLFIGITTYVGFQKMSQTVAHETLAYEIIGKLHFLESSLVDVESGQRGYLLTSKEDFLDSYTLGINSVTETISSLSTLIKNPEQLQRLQDLKKICADKIAWTDKTLSLSKSGRKEEGVDRVRSGSGKVIMDSFHNKINELVTAEEIILTQRKASSDAAYNFAQSVSMFGTMIIILLALTALVVLYRNITNKLNLSINAISTTSMEISATVEQHENTARQQASSVAETASTVDEINTSTIQNAEQAEAVADITKQALLSTDEGVHIAQQVNTEMDALKEIISAIGTQMLHLSEQTNQINNIAILVSDITSQINMLALNAAVEAVRAGEQGKGFSVIAQEVRKLADQGKKSVEKVNVIVSDIQKATNSAVMVTENGTKTVNELTQTVQKAGEIFSNISGIANNVYEKTTQVALNGKQQLTAVKQITIAMNEINAGSKQTAAGITQTKTALQKLTDTSEALKRVV